MNSENGGCQTQGNVNIPTHIMCIQSCFLAQENPVWPMRFVSLRFDPVVIHGRQFIGTGWDRIGEITQGRGDSVTAAMAQLHQPGQAQGVLIARPGAEQMPVVKGDLFLDELNQCHLSGIEFLDNARFNPDPFFHYPALHPDRRHRFRGSPARVET